MREERTAGLHSCFVAHLLDPVVVGHVQSVLNVTCARAGFPQESHHPRAPAKAHSSSWRRLIIFHSEGRHRHGAGGARAFLCPDPRRAREEIAQRVVQTGTREWWVGSTESATVVQCFRELYAALVEDAEVVCY